MAGSAPVGGSLTRSMLAGMIGCRREQQDPFQNTSELIADLVKITVKETSSGAKLVLRRIVSDPWVRGFAAAKII